MACTFLSCNMGTLGTRPPETHHGHTDTSSYLYRGWDIQKAPMIVKSGMHSTCTVHASVTMAANSVLLSVLHIVTLDPYIMWLMYAVHLTTIFSIYKMHSCPGLSLDLYEGDVDSGSVGKRWSMRLRYTREMISCMPYKSSNTLHMTACALIGNQQYNYVPQQVPTRSPSQTNDYTRCGHMNKYQCYNRNA